jgi:hypothetical protein
MKTRDAFAWRRPFPLLVLIFMAASLITACGTGSSVGPVTTATATLVPVPTATATPVPCTTWRIIPSPALTLPQPFALNGVSAAAPTDVWAVGGSTSNATGPRQNTVIERWDGTAWHLVSSPPADNLHSVAVISSDDVWAVGGALNYGTGYHPYRPLIEHWNGTQWSVVPGNAPTSFVQLNGVAALAANDVWAVGEIDTGQPTLGTYRPLLEHWNGTAWQATAGAIPSGATRGSLAAIAAIPGAHQLWAVGAIEQNAAPHSQALIEQWDGSAWHLVASPALPAGATGGGLSGVVALSPKDAWAVGGYTASDGKGHPLILHWNGAAWQIAPGPATAGSLEGVAAAGTHDVRAVGSTGLNGQALIEQWDGTAWQVVTSPTPSGAAKSVLHGVTADSAGSFWAVGSSTTAAGASQTLIERCP